MTSLKQLQQIEAVINEKERKNVCITASLLGVGHDDLPLIDAHIRNGDKIMIREALTEKKLIVSTGILLKPDTQPQAIIMMLDQPRKVIELTKQPQPRRVRGLMVIAESSDDEDDHAFAVVPIPPSRRKVAKEKGYSHVVIDTLLNPPIFGASSKEIANYILKWRTRSDKVALAVVGTNK